jgi:hypothetical protein
MFRKPNPNVIESDEGFSVEVLGRTGLLYKEGLKSMHIDSEISASPGGILISKSSIQKWKPPDENDTIDDIKQDIIIDNIRRAFRFDEEWITVI